jgi:hypothetical protein
VDHRLGSLIRKIRPIGISKAVGAHVQILREFGESLRWENKCIEISKLNFGLEFAGPDTTGGILVLLEQHSKSQSYQHGFIADVEGCDSQNYTSTFIARK